MLASTVCEVLKIPTTQQKMQQVAHVQQDTIALMVPHSLLAVRQGHIIHLRVNGNVLTVNQGKL